MQNSHLSAPENAGKPTCQPLPRPDPRNFDQDCLTVTSVPRRGGPGAGSCRGNQRASCQAPGAEPAWSLPSGEAVRRKGNRGGTFRGGLPGKNVSHTELLPEKPEPGAAGGLLRGAPTPARPARRLGALQCLCLRADAKDSAGYGADAKWQEMPLRCCKSSKDECDAQALAMCPAKPAYKGQQPRGSFSRNVEIRLNQWQEPLLFWNRRDCDRRPTASPQECSWGCPEPQNGTERR